MSFITVDSVLAKARTYYEAHPAGGSLHIVLADGNIEADHVRFCVEYAQKEKDAEGEALAMELLCLTESQRQKIYCRLHNLLEDDE